MNKYFILKLLVVFITVVLLVIQITDFASISEEYSNKLSSMNDKPLKSSYLFDNNELTQVKVSAISEQYRIEYNLILIKVIAIISVSIMLISVLNKAELK